MANEFATYKGVTYSNGRLPAQFKKRLDGNNLALPGDPAVLREDAATSWNKARAEVLDKTGLTLTVRGWNRSIADQERFFFARYKRGAYSPFGDYRSYKGATYGRTNGAAAAIPGTSNHGLGTTVDVVDFGGVGNFSHPRRVAAIGILKKHGWTDTEGRGRIQEPWHLVYVDAKNTQKNVDPPKKEGFLDMLNSNEQDELLRKVRELHSGEFPKIDNPWDEDKKFTARTTFKSFISRLDRIEKALIAFARK